MDGRLAEVIGSFRFGRVEYWWPLLSVLRLGLVDGSKWGGFTSDEPRELPVRVDGIGR